MDGYLRSETVLDYPQKGFLHHVSSVAEKLPYSNRSHICIAPDLDLYSLMLVLTRHVGSFNSINVKKLNFNIALCV